MFEEVVTFMVFDVGLKQIPLVLTCTEYAPAALTEVVGVVAPVLQR